MKETKHNILIWGHETVITESLKRLLDQDMPDTKKVYQDRSFKIEDSLMSQCHMAVVELSDAFNPLPALFTTWPGIPVLVLVPLGSELTLKNALKYPISEFMTLDPEHHHLDILVTVITRCLVSQRPRFSLDVESARIHETQTQTGEQDFKQLYSLLRTMTDTVPDMIWAKDTDGKYIYTNTSTCKYLLNTHNTLEPIGRDIAEFIQRERELHADEASWYTYGDNCQATDQETYANQRLSRFKESGFILGNYVILDIYKAPLIDDAGVCIGIVGTARDITSHEETKERYRKLFDHSPDPVVVHIEGTVVAANQAAANFVGADNAQEYIGTDVNQFVHPDYRKKQMNYVFEPAAENTHSIPMEEKYLTLNGSVRDVETNSVPIKYGNQNAWMVTFRDITERKSAQEAVHRSLREKEYLLNEIYHRTKNNMQVVSAIINIRSREVTDTTSLQMFKEIRDRIAAMSLAHDKLYDAQDLSAIDFKAYLEQLSSHLSQSYAETARRAPIRIKAEDVVLSIDQAVPLGLVINEILTNAYKYAFPDGRSGRIDLNMSIGSAGELLLYIRDDGIGLPLNAFNDSLSTIIIKGLVHDQLGGSVTFDGKDGTRFRISIPDREVVRRI